MNNGDLTPPEIKSLLRDHLDQCLDLAGMLVATDALTAIMLHIEHATMHLEKEMKDGDEKSMAK